MPKRMFECSDCGHVWRVTRGQPSPDVCPECESENIHHAQEQKQKGRDRRQSRRRDWDGEKEWRDD